MPSEIKFELKLCKVKTKENVWQGDHEIETVKSEITEEQYKAIAKLVFGGRS